MFNKKIYLKENEMEESFHYHNSIKEQKITDDKELINYDDSSVICYGIKRNLLIKRIFLPLFPGGIAILILFDNIRNCYYLFPLIVFCSTFILFINFPILVVQSNLKPTYFGQELFIDANRLPYLDLSLKEKKKFLINIKWLLILLYSALTTVLSDYWLFKTANTTSYFEIIGVTGGILKIFQSIASIGGELCLGYTRKKALKHSEEKGNIDTNQGVTTITTVIDNDVEMTTITTVKENDSDVIKL
jgi:hypothetical protein|tara:strand:+ start:920 stop:1657 length:738 start_codon:yes stop_codon:yes gene_type:complete